MSGISTKPSPDCFFFLLHLYQPQQPRWRFARDLGCRDRSVQPFVCFPGAFVPWDSASASASTHSLIGLTDALRSRPAGLPTFRLSASCLVSNLSDLNPEERSDNELAYTCIPTCDINTHVLYLPTEQPSKSIQYTFSLAIAPNNRRPYIFSPLMTNYSTISDGNTSATGSAGDMSR